MDAKFSPRVREIMFRSHEEAVKLGNSYIGLEHLFLGIIDGKALPVIEIIPKTGFFDYTNKYQSGATQEVRPAQIDNEIAEKKKRRKLRNDYYFLNECHCNRHSSSFRLYR